MKYFFTFLVLLAQVRYGQAQIIIPAPPLFGDPTVMLYGDGRQPVVFSMPRVTEPVTIVFQDSAAPPCRIVEGIQIKGDSLVIATTETCWGGGTTRLYHETRLVFDRAGLYRAYERNAGVALKSLGSFRIYPIIATKPKIPLAIPADSRPVVLQLIVGQTHTVCPPTFTSIATEIKSHDIFVSYTEVPFNGICPRLYVDPPLQYGPLAALDSLSAGTYTIYIEDSVSIGTITVEKAIRVSGSATIMQHPLIDMIPRPVPGAKITAEIYEPCPWIGLGITGVICSTTTGSQGEFTMELPESLACDLTATQAGYYPQTVPLAAGQSSVSFEMLDTLKTAITDMAVTVTSGTAPLESAYVSLYAGHELAFCPLLAAKAAQTSFSGRTDRTGQISFTGIELTPFIDYIYSVTRNISGTWYEKNGMIRLYQAAGWENTLNIDLGVTTVKNHGQVEQDGPAFGISTNPGNGDVVIMLPLIARGAAVWVHDVRGNVVTCFEKAAGDVVLRAKDMTNGIYFVTLQTDGKGHTQKVLLNK